MLQVIQVILMLLKRAVPGQALPGQIANRMKGHLISKCMSNNPQNN